MTDLVGKRVRVKDGDVLLGCGVVLNVTKPFGRYQAVVRLDDGRLRIAPEGTVEPEDSDVGNASS